MLSNFAASEIAKVRWEEGFESELDYAQAVHCGKKHKRKKQALEIELKRTLTSIAIFVGLTPEELCLSVHDRCRADKHIQLMLYWISG